MSPTYRIVEADTIQDLEDSTNTAMADGWVPQGGAWLWSESICQSMVRWPPPPAVEKEPAQDPDEWMFNLDVPQRAYNCLKWRPSWLKLHSLADLCQISRKELLGIKNMGPVTVNAIARTLDEMGLQHRLREKG